MQTDRTIHFPMSEDQLLMLYQHQFPGEPYDTEAALKILRFAGDVGYHCWNNGAETLQRLYEQQERQMQHKPSA